MHNIHAYIYDNTSFLVDICRRDTRCIHHQPKNKKSGSACYCEAAFCFT